MKNNKHDRFLWLRSNKVLDFIVIAYIVVQTVYSASSVATIYELFMTLPPHRRSHNCQCFC